MPRATVDGVGLWYELSGSGEPMVLIGGSLWGRRNWDPVLPTLERQFTLLSTDLRGYGQSDPSGLSAATIEMWADDIAGLMNAIGWEKAHINGTSFGGTIALAIGIRHPDRCLSVIANSCLARPDKTSEQRYDAFIRYAEEVGMGRELLAKLGGYGGEANYLETHADLVKKSLAMAAGTPLETWVAANRALKKVDLSQGLPLCSVATLVIAGDQDNTTPLDLQPPGLGTRQIVALLPNAALIVFKGAGHPTIFERPAQHARQTVEFVNAVREFRVVE